jgi:hypothetical protein
VRASWLGWEIGAEPKLTRPAHAGNAKHAAFRLLRAQPAWLKPAFFAVIPAFLPSRKSFFKDFTIIN